MDRRRFPLGARRFCVFHTGRAAQWPRGLLRLQPVLSICFSGATP